MVQAKYLIVGGGVAGGAAARAIRQANPEGRLILITDEPYPPLRPGSPLQGLPVGQT